MFFDDFKVEQVKGPVVQQDDYYPFGLAYNSYQRENSVKNRFKFQGQECIDALDLGWDSFKWRNHQPEIGRFFSIDPLAEKYFYNSPYAFSENKVTSHIELEGLEAVNATDASFVYKSSTKNSQATIVHSYNGVNKTVTYDNNGTSTRIGFVFDHGYSKAAGTAGMVGAVNGGEYPRTGSDFEFSKAIGAKTGEDPGALWASGAGNTVRHFVGQALVTSAFGEEFAKEAGDFHERERGFSADNRDDAADLINNAYGRDFGKNFDINELAKSPENVAGFLNAASVQILKSTEYGNDKSISKIISGQEKIFSSDSKVVKQLHYAISKAILDGAGKK
ncbi:RHS repeat domain-containing protein [Chryseolinea lacunae]|uniref:DUF6973 domain-containing protein n=1 Tax=Chryseolinea lacunae TaxID=2801331 RepID=A0ABS1KZT8_9BACT|nr:hypothetical protein [Chryseolinea lacunae]